MVSLFALLNNIIEIRLDVKKFVIEFRRSVVVRVKDIGEWFSGVGFERVSGLGKGFCFLEVGGRVGKVVLGIAFLRVFCCFFFG